MSGGPGICVYEDQVYQAQIQADKQGRLPRTPSYLCLGHYPTLPRTLLYPTTVVTTYHPCLEHYKDTIPPLLRTKDITLEDGAQAAGKRLQ
jgi:hypothetical protein